MNFIISIFSFPLGIVMSFLYDFTSNYGVSLILFTIFVKLLMIPISVKQQKSTAKMTSLKPRMDELQKKYGKDKARLQEEMGKMYQEEKYNPAAGCLPLLIQMPIMFGLIDVIYKPMKHIVGLSEEMVVRATEVAKKAIETVSATAPEIDIITAVQKSPELFEFLGKENVEKILNLDLYFVGLNLGEVPTIGISLIVLIPLLTGLTSYLMSRLTMKSQDMGSSENNPAAGMQKSMMIMMPLMSLFFTFQVPAGVGVYWIVSNIIAIIQYKIMNKIYNPKEMAEKARLESEARKKNEADDRKKAKELVKQGSADKTTLEKSMNKKQLNRQKLNEARKRDAIKYGEEYIEVTDEDLK